MNDYDEQKLLQRARCIRASQAIEGYDSPLADVIQSLKEGRSIRGKSEDLLDRAVREGRPEMEVAREYYKIVHGCRLKD